MCEMVNHFLRQELEREKRERAVGGGEMMETCLNHFTLITLFMLFDMLCSPKLRAER